MDQYTRDLIKVVLVIAAVFMGIAIGWIYFNQFVGFPF